VLWIAAAAALAPSAAAADQLVLAVTDARDCALIGASVVARNTTSGVEYKKKSDGGTFALDVPAGPYVVSVSRPGFDDRTESVRVPAAMPRQISLRRKRVIVITSPSEPGVDWSKMYFTGVVRESTNADRIVSNIRVIITPAGDRTKHDSTTTDVEGQFWFNVPDWREIDVHLGDHAEYAAVSPAVKALWQPTQCQVLPLEVDRIDALPPQQLPRAISALDNISLFDMEPEAMRSAVEALRARDLSRAGPAAAQQLAAVQQRVDAQVMELRRSASMAAEYSRLMSMTPGAIGIGVNGAESRFNNVLIDGAVATDLFALSAPPPIVTMTPPEPPAATPATLFERAPAADVDQPGLTETNLARRKIGGRWLFDAAAFGTAQWLTSQPVKLTCFCAQGTTGFGTVDFHDATVTTGGSVVSGRLNVSVTFVSRDASAVQPGADGTQNATKRQVLERLTWNVRGAWFITQSYSDGIRTVGDAPTIAQPFLTLVTYSQRMPTLSATVRRQTGADTLWEAVGSTAIGAYARGTPDSATDAPWRHDLQTGRSIGGSYGAGFAARADDRLRTRFARTLGTGVVHRFVAGAEYARSTEHGTWIVPGGVHRFTPRHAAVRRAHRSVAECIGVQARRRVRTGFGNLRAPLARARPSPRRDYDREPGSSSDRHERSSVGRGSPGPRRHLRYARPLAARERDASRRATPQPLRVVRPLLRRHRSAVDGSGSSGERVGYAGSAHSVPRHRRRSAPEHRRQCQSHGAAQRCRRGQRRAAADETVVRAGRLQQDR